MKRVTIVYYAFLNARKRWTIVVLGQLNQLKNTGLLKVANLHVHLTGNADAVSRARSSISEIIPEAVIHSSSQNQFEHPGIHLIWRLAKEHPENVYLYFHSKGMVFKWGSRRTIEERRIYQSVVVPWKRVLEIFDADPTINKVGVCASEAGWMWFNFWWARGTALARCEEPIITTRRHYYEDWLHRTTDGTHTCQDCYSLAGNQKGIFYSPDEACRAVKLIPLTS